MGMVIDCQGGGVRARRADGEEDRQPTAEVSRSYSFVYNAHKATRPLTIPSSAGDEKHGQARCKKWVIGTEVGCWA
ncbi:hypothetical protein PanWU01x14_229630 [Parasponia andersonii]|uniref:Uncharacterized protein n=1 Tax=Parasponia andersonii TaxID=3476 RepID=A0A2P5BL87_PARAD|nr:hypothetical protein PanWU01x14_229630 [Parasponia andersonii]